MDFPHCQCENPHYRFRFPKSSWTDCWCHHNKKQLLDNTTNLQVNVLFSRETKLSLTPLPNSSNPFTSIISQYSTILQPTNYHQSIKYSVTHHLITTGPPVHSQACRFSPDKLSVAHNEFEHMLQLGIIRPSSSPWSLPLHMVSKKNGDWRPCGDYCALNCVATPDHYPIPQIQDFTATLHVSTIFSKLDLTLAYHTFQFSQTTYQKLLSLHHLACSNSFVCHLVFTMQHRYSNA